MVREEAIEEKITPGDIVTLTSGKYICVRKVLPKKGSPNINPSWVLIPVGNDGKPTERKFVVLPEGSVLAAKKRG